MNFTQALYFRGINTKKPIEMSHNKEYWYGFLVHSPLFGWEFYGIMRHFADRHVLMGERFGSTLEPDFQNDETLNTLQRVNPFVGTTHYPDLAMSMRNISRIKLIGIGIAETSRIIWQLIELIWYTTTGRVMIK